MCGMGITLLSTDEEMGVKTASRLSKATQTLGSLVGVHTPGV